jgi:poly(3-hydroxybutyrate) depolymerase
VRGAARAAIAAAAWSATVFSYGGCDAGSLVRLYRMDGFGHDWPSGRDVSASEEIDRWLLSARPGVSLGRPGDASSQGLLVISRASVQ